MLERKKKKKVLSFWRERNKKKTNMPIFLVIACPLVLLSETVD